MSACTLGDISGILCTVSVYFYSYKEMITGNKLANALLPEKS